MKTTCCRVALHKCTVCDLRQKCQLHSGRILYKTIPKKFSFFQDGNKIFCCCFNFQQCDYCEIENVNMGFSLVIWKEFFGTCGEEKPCSYFLLTMTSQCLPMLLKLANVALQYFQQILYDPHDFWPPFLVHFSNFLNYKWYKTHNSSFKPSI